MLETQLDIGTYTINYLEYKIMNGSEWQENSNNLAVCGSVHTKMFTKHKRNMSQMNVLLAIF